MKKRSHSILLNPQGWWEVGEGQGRAAVRGADPHPVPIPLPSDNCGRPDSVSHQDRPRLKGCSDKSSRTKSPTRRQKCSSVSKVGEWGQGWE